MVQIIKIQSFVSSTARKVYGTASQSKLKSQEPYKNVIRYRIDKYSTAKEVMQHMQHNNIRFN